VTLILTSCQILRLSFDPTSLYVLIIIRTQKPIMSKVIRTFTRGALALALLEGPLAIAQTEQSSTPLFPDKSLEKAVRKFVFEKRDNDKPLTEADVANLSTIQATGLGITNLAGLEKCQSLASLDLAKNRITDLSPLKGLTKIQYLNLAENQIADVSPLSGVAALQYIELSHNRVKDLKPLESLTNLASLYLSYNQIADISPVVKLPRLASLYLDHNQIKSIAGIGSLKGLWMLSLSNNSISDIAPLEALTSLFHLFLENNKIRDLTPLVNAAKKDSESEKRFAPFLNLYLKGNSVRSSQVSKLKDYGVRVQN
jgi:Leucine-rich repeat (LRR) protein